MNLAYEAGRSGSRVLVWDLDPQGGATFLFRVRPRVKGGTRRLVGAKGDLAEHVRACDLPSVHLVPADFSLRHLDLHLDDSRRPTERLADLLSGVAERYDVAILDCPPSISLASESVFGAADALLVPVIPSTLSMRTLSQLSDFLDGSLPLSARRPAVLLHGRRAQAAASGGDGRRPGGLAGRSRGVHSERQCRRADGRRARRRAGVRAHLTCGHGLRRPLGRGVGPAVAVNSSPDRHPPSSLARDCRHVGPVRLPRG